MQHASPRPSTVAATSSARTAGPGPGAGVSSGRRRSWRRWLFALLSVALLAFVVSQFTTVSELGADFSGADLRWLAAALALQAVFFLLYGALYQHGLAAVEVEGDALRLVPVLLASIFAKTVLPLTAAPAAAVFIDDATARGQSGPRTAVAMIVVLVVDLITALPFVVAGAAALVLRSTLVGFALVGVALFGAFIAALLVALVLAVRWPGRLAALLSVLGGVMNGVAARLGRPSVVVDDWGHETALQLVAGVASVPRQWRHVVMGGGVGLAIHIVNLAGLAALFLAFGQPLDPAALAAGFGMSIVVFVVSIVPDGIGAVEGAMALVFMGLGMAPTAAIVVTIAYRVLNVWIPVVLGFVCARYLRLFGGREAGTAVAEGREPARAAA
jgi:uncharacterized membrane protein YbhN (UPF0104 family)